MIDIAAIFKNKGMERDSLLEYGFCKEGDISKKCFHNECFKGEQSK